MGMQCCARTHVCGVMRGSSSSSPGDLCYYILILLPVFFFFVYHQVKVALPTQLTDRHHLVFTFYHVSCDLSKMTSTKAASGKTSVRKSQHSLEATVGHAWLPLLINGRWGVGVHAPPGISYLTLSWVSLWPLKPWGVSAA